MTIEHHRGQVMHYAGDAVLAKFNAVVDALSSAVAIQNELTGRNQDLPDERRVQFRIGVNLGDVIATTMIPLFHAAMTAWFTGSSQ